MLVRENLVHCPALGKLEILHDHLLGRRISYLFPFSTDDLE